MPSFVVATRYSLNIVTWSPNGHTIDQAVEVPSFEGIEALLCAGELVIVSNDEGVQAYSLDLQHGDPPVTDRFLSAARAPDFSILSSQGALRVFDSEWRERGSTVLVDGHKDAHDLILSPPR